MLILTRRIGEYCIIHHEKFPNDLIHVGILGVNSNQIRLGFDASQHWIIHREEIYLKIYECTKEDQKAEDPKIIQPTY